MLTREICKRCNRESAVGFSVPDSVWFSVVPYEYSGSVLCLGCFAWDRDIAFFPVSLVTHKG
jgi:hypothetical protein